MDAQHGGNRLWVNWGIFQKVTPRLSPSDFDAIGSALRHSVNLIESINTRTQCRTQSFARNRRRGSSCPLFFTRPGQSKQSLLSSEIETWWRMPSTPSLTRWQNADHWQPPVLTSFKPCLKTQAPVRAQPKSNDYFVTLSVVADSYNLYFSLLEHP